MALVFFNARTDGDKVTNPRGSVRTAIAGPMKTPEGSLYLTARSTLCSRLWRFEMYVGFLVDKDPEPEF